MLKLIFMGTASVIPETGGDSTTFLINDHILIDTGWTVALRLPVFGIDPLQITHLFFTHFHHDHYMGLPQLLFQRALLAAKQPGVPALVIGGPAADLERILHLTREFFQEGIYPGVLSDIELMPLNPGDTFSIGELSFTVGKAIHPVPAHGYRVEESATGKVLGITGDTLLTEEMPTFFKGVDLLIAESSFGARSAPEKNPYCHMGALDAAKLAEEAGAQRLALTHGKIENRVDSVRVAQEIFPKTFWPQDGETVVLSP